jgi:hypothetical protein
MSRCARSGRTCRVDAPQTVAYIEGLRGDRALPSALRPILNGGCAARAPAHHNTRNIREIEMSNALENWPRYTPQLVVQCPDDAPDIWVEMKARNIEFPVDGAVLDASVERSVLRKGLARLYRFEHDLIEVEPIVVNGARVRAWSYPERLPARIIRPPVGEPWLADAVHGEWWGPDFTLNPVFVEAADDVPQVLGRDFLEAFRVEPTDDGQVEIIPRLAA